MRGPAQYGPEASQQFAGVKGLCEVIVGAKLQAEDPVDVVAFGRQHDGRDIAHATDLLQDIEPAHTWQHDIEYDEVEVAGPQRFDTLFAAQARDDSQVVRLEILLEHLAQCPVVIDDKYPGCRHRFVLRTNIQWSSWNNRLPAATRKPAILTVLDTPLHIADLSRRSSP